VGDPGSAEEEGGRELVVRREQRERTVQKLHALTLQPRQAPEPGLDPVERGQDVEAGEREIAVANTGRGRGLREPCALPLLGEGRGQRAIRLRRLAEDDDRAVPLCGSRRPRRHALAPFNRELDAWNCHHASSAAAVKVGVRAR
jgi:hypothetical protein